MHELLAMLFLVMYRDRKKLRYAQRLPEVSGWGDSEEVDEWAEPDSFQYIEHDTFTLFSALMGDSDSPGVRSAGPHLSPPHPSLSVVCIAQALLRATPAATSEWLNGLPASSHVQLRSVLRLIAIVPGSPVTFIPFRFGPLTRSTGRSPRGQLRGAAIRVRVGSSVDDRLLRG